MELVVTKYYTVYIYCMKYFKLTYCLYFSPVNTEYCMNSCATRRTVGVGEVVGGQGGLEVAGGQGEPEVAEEQGEPEVAGAERAALHKLQVLYHCNHILFSNI